MNPFSRLKRSSNLCLLTGLLLAGAAHAQGVDCRSLQAQLTSIGPGDPARAAQFAKAVQKQQYELDRTVAYSRSIGCDHRQFLFFGAPPPAECGEIGSRINRMQGNLAQLQAETARASGDAQRRDLTARFNAYCRGAPPQPRGFFDSLFGTAPAPPPPLSVPDSPDVLPPPADEPPTGGTKAVCVRSCDGGFFPVSYSATRSQLGNLAQRCQALCPNAQTTLFTYSPSKDIDDAVSIDGKPYRDMPNADKFRSKFDPTCSCKPANESWVQALSAAEHALGHESSGDILVTPQRSDAMAQPKAPAKGKAAQKADQKRGGVQGDDATAADGIAAQQVPTASNESADIGPKTSVGGPAYGLDAGQTREEVGPDGVQKKVRVIGPM
jgi:hypothetical protein